MKTLVTVVLVSLCLVGLVGCGSGSKIVPVSGKVTCRGVPIKDAAITFSPLGKEGEKETGKAAGGSIDAKGEFFVGTYSEKDGALIGKHRVIISYNNPYEPHECIPTNDLILEVTKSDNVFEIELDKTFKK